MYQTSRTGSKSGTPPRGPARGQWWRRWPSNGQEGDLWLSFWGRDAGNRGKDPLVDLQATAGREDLKIQIMKVDGNSQEVVAVRGWAACHGTTRFAILLGLFPSDSTDLWLCDSGGGWTMINLRGINGRSAGSVQAMNQAGIEAWLACSCCFGWSTQQLLSGRGLTNWLLENSRSRIGIETGPSMEDEFVTKCFKLELLLTHKWYFKSVSVILRSLFNLPQKEKVYYTQEKSVLPCRGENERRGESDLVSGWGV